MIKDFAFGKKSDKYEICFTKWVWQPPLTKRLPSPPLPLIIITLLSTNRQSLMHIQTNFGTLRGKNGVESRTEQGIQPTRKPDRPNPNRQVLGGSENIWVGFQA